MRVKGHLKAIIGRAVLHIKSIGILALVPFIALDILLPMLSFFAFQKHGATEGFHLAVIQFGQWLMPLCSIWFTLFVLREYVEAPGREILFVCKNKCKLEDMLCLFVLPMVNIFAQFVAYEFLLPGLLFEFIRIASVCVLFFGITYAFAFFAKTIFVPLFALLFYTIASIATYSNKMLFPFYYSNEFITPSMYVFRYFPFLLVGFVCTVLGISANKRSTF